MSSPQMLLVLMLVQQGLLGALWLGVASLGLARQPALHWGAATLVLAASLGLVALRDAALSPWVGYLLGNTLGIVAYAAMRRGVQHFCGLQRTDRAQVAAVALGTAALAWAIGAGGTPALWVSITSATLAWILFAAAGDGLRGLRGEFGPVKAWACMTPLLLAGALFAVRAVLTLSWTDVAGRPASAGGAFNVAVGLTALTLFLLMHLGLGAMVVLRTVQQLQAQSDRDALTGVLNRRGLTAWHERHFGRAPRHAGYALLLLDVDHFKQVNDRHGHECGDTALVAVARALHAALRPADAVARTGGEEFCVVLADVNAQTAQATAERLRLAVGSAPVRARETTLRLTCSVGVSGPNPAGLPLPDAMRRADQAMYEAKAQGRDRVVAWQAQPLASTSASEPEPMPATPQRDRHPGGG